MLPRVGMSPAPTTKAAMSSLIRSLVVNFDLFERQSLHFHSSWSPRLSSKDLSLSRSPHFKFPLKLGKICVETMKVLEEGGTRPWEKA